MMRIELVKRPQPSRLFSALSPLLALSLTLIFGGLAFALMGKDPLHALYVFFVEPLFDIWSWHELLVKAAPLILIAVGLCVCFLSNNWNIGAEGQFIAGAIAGSILPVMFPDLQSWVVLPLMMLMGMAGGAAYASIPALLKVRFNTNEILTSLMLNDSAILPEIWSASGRAHWGFIFALVAAVVVWLLLKHALKGFEVKVIGQSPRAGRFAGFSAGKMVFFVFAVSGALAGLAGIAETSGAIGQLRPVISPGYGFTAIIVAFLGRLNPLGAIAAGLVLALSYLGGEAAQVAIGISEKSARVFQGMILFFVLACDTLILYRIRFISGRQAGKA